MSGVLVYEEERASAALEKWLAEGSPALSDEERVLAHVQGFIVDMDMAGLSGYLYNHAERVEEIETTADALARIGQDQLAGELLRWCKPLRAAMRGAVSARWETVVATIDPERELDGCQKSIRRLILTLRGV
jgi:hypothetical protein